MTYIIDDTSIEDAQPIELYEFVSNVKTYRYTSYISDFINLSAQTFEHANIKRSKIKSSPFDKKNDLIISIPIKAELIQDFAFGIPPQVLNLTITRQHGASGDAIIIWKGPVTSIKTKNNLSELTVPSVIRNRLSLQIPNVYYQPLCNHVLYDSRCNVSEILFTINTTLTAAITNTQLNLSSVGGNPNQYFRGGQIIRTIDGEQRLITDQIGNIIKINYPFKTINSGDLIQIKAGCSHKRDDPQGCIQKFNNVANYGGEDWIPLINPFSEGIK